jgi:hypothetical protein
LPVASSSSLCHGRIKIQRTKVKLIEEDMPKLMRLGVKKVR